MGTFRELRVWQEAINLAANIYHITRQPPFSNDFGLANQIQRASVSIASNIAEGEDRGYIKDQIRFHNIAKGSTAEVITQLIIAHKIGYINDVSFKKLEDQAKKIRAQLIRLIQSKEQRMDV